MRNIYDFNDVKRLVSCRQYLASRGIELNAASRCAAVWRGGKNPNVHVYEKDGQEQWKDFKTEQGGSVIDLAMVVEGFSDIQNAANALGERFNVPPKAKKQKAAPLVTRAQMLLGKGFVLDTTYDYTDETGKPVYYVDRYRWPNPFAEPPEGFKAKEFVQRTTKHEGLDADTPQLLYHLPEVIASKEVFIVEGEKDVETLRKWGFTATTNSGGASKDGSKKWPVAMNQHLQGKDVVVIADNDDKGQAHAQNLRDLLTPIAASLRVLTISALPKGDVTDWKEKEKGTAKKLRAAVDALPVPVRKDAESEEVAAAVATAKMANIVPLSNYTERSVEGKNGRRKVIDEPRTINDLIEDVHTRFLGFPKRIGDNSLFDHDRDTNTIEVLENRDALFAWIGRKSKHVIKWKKLDDSVTKSELFHGLIKCATRYEKTSSVPDYPMRKDVYYTFRDKLKPTPEHEAFKTLLSHFSPDGDAFSAMLAVFFAAPMFFRPGVQRPCWIIDSHEARGVGKTTLVNLVANLYGCRPISTNRNELERNQQELLKRIVSVSGRDSRILLLDNLKGFFDDPQWAEFVTTPSFSGRSPYGHGEESRLNDLTFVITSNSANIGSDTESRSFMIFLKRPVSVEGWSKSVLEYIARRRMDIFGDIYDILTTAAIPADLHTRTRVPDFEREIVYPICGSKECFDFVMESMIAERESANTDSERARDIVDDVREGLRKAITGFDPDTGIAFIRTNAMGFWLKNQKLDTQDLWNMINTKQITCFHRTIRAFPRNHSHRFHGRGFLYIGPNAIPPATPDVPILRLSGDKTIVLLGVEQSARLMRQLAEEGWFSRATDVVDAESEDDDNCDYAQVTQPEIPPEDVSLLPM